jgi:predicted CoA-binding protein
MPTSDIATIRRILAETRTIAMVGLSADWYRPSYFAAKYLQEHGYRVIPVNPKYPEILGEKAYASLRDIPEKIDVVDLFQRADRVPPFVDDAIAIGAKVVWMQLGIVNEEASAKARDAGLEVVMDHCMKIEYGRLLGGLSFCGVNTGVISSKRPQHVPH